MSEFFSSRLSSLVPYVPGEQPQDKKYIKLNTNESAYTPSPLAIKYGEEAMKNLQLYSDPEVKSLVEAATKFFGIKKDRIIFTNGSDEALNFAFTAFCDDTHSAAFADITYGFYSVFADLNGVKYEQIPLRDDFSINVEDYIGINKTIFIANPNAPTGIALGLTDIERIVKSNPNNVVVIDEAYVDFGGESAIGLIDRYENLLVVRTFSKSRNLAGARLGFAMGNERLIADLNTVKYSTNPYNVNAVTTALGIGALEDVAYFTECAEKTKKVREYTERELARLGFEFNPSSANFVFARCPTVSGFELYKKLKERGILVRHFETPRLKDYNRITIGNEEQMKAFIGVTEDILKGEKIQ